MWFYWIIVPLAWLVWHIAFRIRVIGRENLIHDRGFVIAPNHISAIDPVFVVIARFWGRPMVIMAKEELFEISRLLNSYFAPENACASYHLLLKHLKAFEQALHHHIHLENNIVFPRAIALEAKLKA